MSTDLCKKLINFDLFKGISQDLLPKLLKCLNFQSFTYKKNEYIAMENEKSKGIGIVLSGSISIIKETLTGSRIILANFKEGDTFGEIIAFSSMGIFPSTVFVQTDCEIMFIYPEKILGICENICASHKILIKNILCLISNRALLLNKKVEYLTIKSIRSKLCKYLLEQYKKTGTLTFTLPLNRENLADFLNVSRPSMSRELCKLRDEGIIEFYKETIKIKNLEQLKE